MVQVDALTLVMGPTEQCSVSQQAHVAVAPEQSLVMLVNPQLDESVTVCSQMGAPYAEQLASATAVPALAASAARLMRRANREPSKHGVVEMCSLQKGQRTEASFTCLPHPTHKKSFM